MKKIGLSDNFTYGKIVLYAFPAIISIIVSSSFGLVDGYFVSNLLGVDQFAAVNLVYPILIIFPAAGYMIGSGGNAVISDRLGKGDKEEACGMFSMCTALTLIAGMILGAIGYFLLPVLISLMGAESKLHGYCMEYGRIMLLFLPAVMVNMAFERLWITAEKSWNSFIASIINGAVNVFLDYLFIRHFSMGIMGAGLATAIANLAAALFTVVYFFLPNNSSLRFVRFGSTVLGEIPGILFDGASEMFSSIAGAITSLVMNARVLLFFGERGVSAVGVFDLIFGIFAAYFFGIADTSVSVIGYKHGNRALDEIKVLLKRGIILMLAGGIIIFILCELLAGSFSAFFVGYDDAAYDLTAHSIKIQAATFILYGFNIYVSSVFTGLEDGLPSLIIAVNQSLITPVALLFLLPLLFGKEGIWYTLVVESCITAILATLLLLIRFKKSLMSEKDRNTEIPGNHQT